MRLIDLHHLGRERVIAAWLLDGRDLDPGRRRACQTLLQGLGEPGPPGAAADPHPPRSRRCELARWSSAGPELEVYVHERGAPHLIDPIALLESATRLYGEDMDRLWGEMLPVPEATGYGSCSGGERILDGAFEVAYTPGHASHHVSYLHDGTAFVGDVGGVRITSGSLTIPPTPPPGHRPRGLAATRSSGSAPGGRRGWR